MIGILEAVDLAEARKRAAIATDVEPGLRVTGSEAGDRAVFVGLDIDYQELAQVAQSVGANLTTQAVYLPIGALLSTAWVDGLLIGLLMGIDRGRGDE